MKKFAVLFSMLLPLSAWASDWKLDTAHSSLNFVSIKKGSVGEVHHFNTLHGSIAGKQANLTIDLASVETGVAVRNERMQSMLFDVSHFAEATITADISSVDLAALSAGVSTSATLPLTVNLHGIEKTISADVTVTGLAGGGLLVSSRAPIVIKAADFGLDGGIEALREVAKLDAIATSVPVTFQLQFAH
ncbi:YceI family protein [Mariprofundus erugo]|uniref:YceI family protein n=1 Tax=Mariprofundus erugo TaxID=2528639 RepID=A0A5R9GKJ4_9PROT|nr:YceI family protein [Mariprofundus erugo]TLS65549.1 YceI family protein [Mariprofundus erugo]TLS74045.1 YceI family protein [Mariprofundus erugo]